MSGSNFSATRFEELGDLLDPTLINALNSLGFETATRVQVQTIPRLIGLKDTIVQAPTGSGKTLSFLIPVVQILLKKITKIKFTRRDVGSIILSPTRELAQQTYNILEKILEQVNAQYVGEQDETALEEEIPNRLRCVLFVGGADIESDVQRFSDEGAHIVVATPGRLEFLLHKKNVIDCKGLEILILDEADRLLDLGFEKSLLNILSALPRQRRTGLFSATMSDSLDELVRLRLRNPIKIVIKSNSDENSEGGIVPQTLSIYYHICKIENKLEHFLAFLNLHREKRFIVYLPTCYCVDFFSKIFSEMECLKDHRLFYLHGKMSGLSRRKIYKKIMSGSEIPLVILCTDVAARGLDIPNIHYVIQMESPQDPRMFSHRCGRTARLDNSGNALLYLSPNEEAYIYLLKTRNISMSQLPQSAQPQKFPMRSKEIEETIKSECLQDRCIYEKGIKAFVSWCRFYSEHRANYIFRLQEVDLAGLIKFFGLIKLPKMPELKGIKYNGIQELEVNSIKYKDALRENKRIKDQNLPKVPKVVENPRSVPWSKKKELKEKRKSRKVKPLEEKRNVSRIKQSSSSSDEEEWKGLARELDVKIKTKKAKSGPDLNLTWEVEDDLFAGN